MTGLPTPMASLPFVPDDFASPLRLLILLAIPALIAVYVLLNRRKNRRGMRFTNTSMLEVVMPKQSQWRRHLSVALALLSLGALTMAFARPEATVQVPRERATVVVVLDASRSMAATDVKPTRLDAAKTAAKAFITSLPAKFNVSVVSMAGNVTILTPPTQDHQVAIRAVDTIELQDSTAIGAGIDTALQAVSQAPKDPKNPNSTAPAAIVLLSDGENTTGKAPAQASADAASKKVPVYTIAYGTENGFVDLDGQRYAVPPNDAQLKGIAEQTGGIAYQAASADELKTVYERIGSSVGSEPAKREVTSRFALYGFVFAVLAALGAVTLAARWP
ncbi:Ca-activated chloride channel family protein [Friedmanniella endophytica]|uniref:Ca-activated chloride channel family protein n=2 Tax=Microlunatus kandeliicorticis TaxID=1759536 RepID=A0A7W3P794_9ACTN|nr:VWA domain-containing protein [Microlunatus kandeliicorticis]MBA8795779.1 Ca-activated chloride channel family protein [Microlunatus kandeliicorticis]